MIYLSPPPDFNPKFEIVSCFVECCGKILLLHRQDYKPQGNTWGVPAGKVEKGESPEEALKREVFEETGILLKDQAFFKTVYVRYPEYDFIYHIFHCSLDEKPAVKIRNKEHKDFCWISPKEALKLPLIQDLDACIRLFYKI